MTTNPEISIIVPVYNVEGYVGQCISSLLHQTATSFECIVVDDGSTDGSVAVVRSLVASDRRFRLVSQVNGGLSDARNTGIRHATGSHLLFLDSDDYLAPYAVEVIVRHLSSVGGDVVQFCSTDFDDRNGLSYPQGATDGLEWPIILESRAQRLSSVANWAQLPVPAWTRCYSREFLKAFEFPKGLYFEDNLLYFYLLSRDPLLSFLRVSLYRYRVRVGSITKPTEGVFGSRHQQDIRAVFSASKELLIREGRADLLAFLERRMKVQVADVDGRTKPKAPERRPPRWAGLLPHVLYRRWWGS